MLKSILLIFGIVFVSVLLVAVSYVLRNPSVCCRYEICQRFTNICVEPIGEFSLSSVRGEEMFFENIRPNDQVDMGYEVRGRVSGEWFFEGDFPVRVLDVNGEVLNTLVATAQGDWMTTELVPFSFELNANIDTDSDIILRLEKDNPSGLVQFDDYVDLPVSVRFSNITMSVVVYFPHEQRGSTDDCSLVFPVSRTIPQTVAVGRASLEELIKGLTANEQESGFFSSINEGVEIRSLTIEDGVARVDFNSVLEEGVGGSCMVTSIRAQIEETLKQFPTVDSVVISIEGRTEDILQP